MSELAEQLIEQALDLPPDERARVAERLLSSLEPELSPIDQLWAAEAETRLDAYKRGEIKTIPAEQVFNSDEDRISRSRPRRVLRMLSLSVCSKDDREGHSLFANGE